MAASGVQLPRVDERAGGRVMPRALPEWIGKTPDSPIPPRVRLRVYFGASGRCQGPCERIIPAGEKWECDYIISLVNGGEHRESNLQVLCKWCHGRET